MNDTTKHIPSMQRPLRCIWHQCYRTLLVEPLMWPCMIEIRQLLSEDPVEMPLMQNEELI